MEEQLIKERLLAENLEFRRLHDEHRDHDLRLSELSAKPFLTSEEEIRERELKKRKLLLKDKMAIIMRDFQKSLQG
ncbi:MAG: DUF465 domain-containing protein [Candidatus Aminicenantales bacterium]